MPQKLNRRILSLFFALALFASLLGAQSASAIPGAMEIAEPPVAATESQFLFSDVPENVRALLASGKALSEVAEDKILQSDSPNELITQHPDGSYTVEVYGAPVSYEDESGRLQFIDTGMIPVQDAKKATEGYAYRNAANGFEVLFSSDARKGILVNERFTMAIADVAALASRSAVVDRDKNSDGRLTYPKAFGEGTYVEYINIGVGLKENIVLERNIGKNRFDFAWASDTHIPVLSEDSKFIQIVAKNNPEQVDYEILSLYVYDAFKEKTIESAEESEPVLSFKTEETTSPTLFTYSEIMRDVGLTWNNQPYGHSYGASSSHQNSGYYEFDDATGC